MRKIILNPDKIKISPIEESPSATHQKREGMFDYINNVMNNCFFGIGLHNTLTNQDGINSILENGIKLKENETVLSTVSSFGIRDSIDKDYLQKAILEYSWRKDEQGTNIIVMVPAMIRHSRGETLFLGFPPYDTSCRSNNYRQTCVFDEICQETNSNGNIPKEFILGYFTNNDGEISFTINPNYYLNLSEDELDLFFDKCLQKVGKNNLIISDAVVNRDIETLNLLEREEQIKIKMEINKKTQEKILKGIPPEVAKTISNNEVQISSNEVATYALLYLSRYLDKVNDSELVE